MSKKNFSFALIVLIFIFGVIVLTSIPLRFVTINEFQQENKGMLWVLTLGAGAITWFGQWIFNITNDRITNQNNLIMELQEQIKAQGEMLLSAKVKEVDGFRMFIDKVAELNENINIVYRSYNKSEESHAIHEMRMAKIEEKIEDHERRILKVEGHEVN